MRLLSIIFASALLTLACAHGKDKTDTSGTDGDADTDTDADADADSHGDSDADSDTDADSDADFSIIDFAGNCADDACDYTITTSSEANLLELDLTETGDSYMYHEYHDEFRLDSENADGSSTYLLHLERVRDPGDVGSGTTLIYGTALSDTTFLFQATNARGYSDCIVTGDDPSYYSSVCRNWE